MIAQQAGDRYGDVQRSRPCAAKWSGATPYPMREGALSHRSAHLPDDQSVAAGRREPQSIAGLSVGTPRSTNGGPGRIDQAGAFQMMTLRIGSFPGALAMLP